MEFSVKITSGKMVQKLVDDEGRIFINTWKKVGIGDYQIVGKSIEEQMEETGMVDWEFINVINQDGLFEIWEAVQNAD